MFEEEAEPRIASQPRRPRRQQHSSSYTVPDNAPSTWPDFLAGQPGKPVRVLVVEDDAHMRRVIADELMADPRTVLVGQAQSFRQARQLIRDHQVDVVLTAIRLSDSSGFELISYAKKLRRAVEVVVLSTLEEEDDALRAFALGAAGFLLKNSWFGGFVQAVLQVVNGGAAVTPSVALRLLRRLDLNHSERIRATAGPSATLSGRECEVLRKIAKGLTSAQIAQELAISAMTVNTHVRNIYQKLNVKSRAQAVSFATAWDML